MKIISKFALLSIMLCSSFYVQASSSNEGVSAVLVQATAGLIIYKTMKIHGEEMNDIGRLPESREKENLKRISLSNARNTMQMAAMSIVISETDLINHNHECTVQAIGFLGVAGAFCMHNSYTASKIKELVNLELFS